MRRRVAFKKSLVILSLLFLPTVSSYAQDAKCALKINVFALRKTNYPQETPIAGARAKIVSLETNEVMISRSVGGVPHYLNLPEGTYNLTVSRAGYETAAKKIDLNCRLTDEKNVFDEFIFLPPKTAGKVYRMPQVDLKILDDSALPASPAAATGKVDAAPLAIAAEIALNERATYLPAPVFPAEMKKLESRLISELDAFVIQVNIEINAAGEVTRAASEIFDDRFQSLAPYVIESAKKSRFVPIKIDGKSARLRGMLIYSFAK